MSESKMVPREPTRAMLAAAWDCGFFSAKENAQIWRAMYDAAPTINEGGQDAAPDGRRVVAEPVPPSPDLVERLQNMKHKLLTAATLDWDGLVLMSETIQNSADAIARLTAERDALRADVARWQEVCTEDARERDALRHDLERLQSVNAELATENERLHKDVAHWKLARKVACDGGEILQQELAKLRADNASLLAENKRLTNEWQRECDDTQRLLLALGMTSEMARTPGGSLHIQRIVSHIKAITAERDALRAERGKG